MALNLPRITGSIPTGAHLETKKRGPEAAGTRGCEGAAASICLEFQPTHYGSEHMGSQPTPQILGIIVLLLLPTAASAQTLTVAQMKDYTTYVLSDQRPICLAGVRSFGQREEPDGDRSPASTRPPEVISWMMAHPVQYEPAPAAPGDPRPNRSCTSRGYLWIVAKNTGIRLTTANQLLLQSGYARIDTQTTASRQEAYERIEFEARINDVGLWNRESRFEGSPPGSAADPQRQSASGSPIQSALSPPFDSTLSAR